MEIVKKILMWIGGLFALLIVLVTFIAISSANYEEEQTPFIQLFVSDFSERWETEDVFNKLTNEFIENVNNTESKLALAQFKTLGKLKSITDIELGNYNTSTDAETGEFSMKATFENGDALINLTLKSIDDKVRVQYFKLTPSTPFSNTISVDQSI